MKKIAILLLVICTFALDAQSTSNSTFYKSINVEVTNTADIPLTDAMVKLPIGKIKKSARFNAKAFIVYEDGKEITSQLYKNGKKKYVLFVSNFEPSEKKTFEIKYVEGVKLIKDYPSRTYAEVAMKFNAVYDGKRFVSDSFENLNKVVVPEIHKDHDALFKYEGAGWESEKVGYRFYLDWRNATDIFGKKVDDLVLHEVGATDITPENEKYHEMNDWGTDIFKVGKSLGIGSPAMMGKEKLTRIEKADKRICEIACNGPLLSEIKTTFEGWKVDDAKRNTTVSNLIAAGSRITTIVVKTEKNAPNITSGFAKHENTEFIKSEFPEGWQYIALYGKQTLVKDNLGLVLFYNKNVLIEQSEDELNYYVVLKPQNDKVTYKYAAAWEQEKDGIKTKKEFVNYINNVVKQLNSPLNVEIKQVK